MGTGSRAPRELRDKASSNETVSDMTFTEAAVEVLRRIGQPTHYKEIASTAVAENLLSHVGVTPESTMGARLLAMSQREGDRRVVATAPGVFALAEWGVTPVAQPTLDEPPAPAEDEAPLRTRERHPPLQEELLVGGRREERRRRGDTDDEGRRRKRYGPPAELAHAWLREKGEPATLAEIAAALRAQDRIAEALERDLGSFEKALKEENRRRKDSRRPLMFEFLDDGRVQGLDLPKDQRPAKKDQQQGKAKAEKRRDELPKPAAADEQRRVVLRSLRRRLAGLDVAALERVVVALLEVQGYRELNMARRSAKEGPLYLCRHRFGAGELRYAVRVLAPGRDLGRTEVQEVRRDVAHFSAQIGAVFGNAECTRDARGEANTPGGSPVMLYGNEALAEALIDAGLGVSRRMIEWLDYDDEFFASIGAEPAFDEVAEQAVEGAPSVETPPAEPPGAPKEEGRGRRRRGRGRRGGESTSSDEASEPATEAEASPTAGVGESPQVVEAGEASPPASEPPVEAAVAAEMPSAEQLPATTSDESPASEPTEPVSADQPPVTEAAEEEATPSASPVDEAPVAAPEEPSPAAVEPEPEATEEQGPVEG